MLIDFEKAFDSLSWKFLYKTLKFFGYSENFLNWIKLFNNEITAYVVQCGFLSKPIKIERGCRQGDPISAYLFLIGAEILTRLIQGNPHIKGVNIEGIELKMTQFADDTTLILDGTQHSLQSALNTLEIYGNYSGLKMNKEKTKVIWIGQKRHSKDKLNVSVNLEWGSTRFTLLGIDFSTNLSEIIEYNYEKALEKIKRLVGVWGCRYLTPLGKITIIKTNLISQCVHLMSTLPKLESFLNKLNSILYKFLWNGKPDKVMRSTSILRFNQGGLKMVDIYKFDKALKVNWIRKLLNHPNTQWSRLINVLFKDIDKVISFGDQYYKTLPTKPLNSFWINVLNDWISLTKSQKIENYSHLVRSCIWYNTNISKIPLFFADWHKKGIYIISDLFDDNGNLLSLKDLNSKFGFKANILNYYTIKAKIELFISRYKRYERCSIARPTYPRHLDEIIRSKQGSKIFYDTYNNQEVQNCTPKCENLWASTVQQQNLNIVIKERWSLIYQICFFSVLDNNMIWFQYRILNKILGTKSYLKKLKIKTEDICTFCNAAEENLDHLFCQCREVSPLWENVEEWIKNKLRINITLTTSIQLLGYLIKDQHFWPLNLILMTTRKYIFWCSKNSFKPNIYLLQKEIKKTFLEQETLSKINSRQAQFNKRWNLWRNIFKGIDNMF